MEKTKQFVKQTYGWIKQVPHITALVVTSLWHLAYSASFIGLGVYTLTEVVPTQTGYSSTALVVAAAVVTASGLIAFVKFLVEKNQPVKKGK